MSTARKALNAVVGAGSTALEEAKTLPKRAAALPGLVSSTVQTVAGKAGSLPQLLSQARKGIRDLPKTAASLPDRAQKQAKELPKLAFGAAAKVRDLAAEASKDAAKRYAGYAKKGEKLLARNGNGTGNGSKASGGAKKASRTRTPKVAHATPAETSSSSAE